MGGGDAESSERTQIRSRSRLTSAEKSTGAIRRRVAFYALLGASFAACLGAVYCWYLWYVTFGACLRTYIFQQQASVLLTPGAAASWQEYFSGLDISSFSAMILACFFTRLAYSGIKDTLWKRYKDGKAYYEHAYDAVLFSPYFESLCIRFGLLGTLLSFLLAAISQMSTPVLDTYFDQDRTVGGRVQEVVRTPDDTTTESASASERAAAADTPPAIRMGDLSGQIFLLLCASLVSTFVGTLIAYVAIPPLNWLSDWAVGTHQRGTPDDEATTERFLRQLDRTSERLAEFETATEALTQAAAGVQRFQTAATQASEHFSGMMELLKQAAHVVEASNQRTDHLTGQLNTFEKQSVRVIRQIHEFANKLEQPLARMSEAAKQTQLATIEGKKAFGELGSVARGIREPLAKISELSTNTWRLVAEVRNSLGDLAKSEQQQTGAIVAARRLFADIGTTLSDLLTSIDGLLTAYQEGQSRQGDAEQGIAAIQRQVSRVSVRLKELRAIQLRQQAAPRNQEMLGDYGPPWLLQDGNRSRGQSARAWWRRWFRWLAGLGRDHRHPVDSQPRERAFRSVDESIPHEPTHK